MSEWPVYLPNQVIKVSEGGDTVIVCCWSRRQKFLEKLAAELPYQLMEKVLAVGNLYTQERGIDFLLRNLLANPKITRILISGTDRTQAGAALWSLCDEHSLTDKGDYWGLAKFPKVKIRKDIPERCIVTLTASVEVIVTPDPHLISLALQNDSRGVEREEVKLFEPPRESSDRLPTNEHAHVIRGKDIPSVYLDILHEIMSFGRVDDTHYDQRQRELLDLVAVIEGGVPFPDTLPEFIPFTLDDLHEYDAQLNNPDMDETLTYLYGNRIRAYFGVDQFKGAAEKLVNDSVCRSAVISLWDPKREGAGKMSGSPCLNHLWFRIREIDHEGTKQKALHMTAVIRSNDMYTGWPENAFGLRLLQERMRNYILNMSGEFQQDGDLLLGETVIMSESAHLYEDCWAPAREVLKKHRHRVSENWDKKGNWIIEVESGRIAARLMDPTGFVLLEFKNTSAAAICHNIANRNLISDVGHAMFIGTQLMQAENKLRAQ